MTASSLTAALLLAGNERCLSVVHIALMQCAMDALRTKHMHTGLALRVTQAGKQISAECGRSVADLKGRRWEKAFALVNVTLSTLP